MTKAPKRNHPLPGAGEGEGEGGGRARRGKGEMSDKLTQRIKSAAHEPVAMAMMAAY